VAEREQGFYWVKRTSIAGQYETIAHWNNTVWYLHGDDEIFLDDDFDEIGERVVRDSEPKLEDIAGLRRRDIFPMERDMIKTHGYEVMYRFSRGLLIEARTQIPSEPSPGPWEYCDGAVFGEWDEARDGRPIICQVMNAGMNGPSTPEGVANGRLIASLPEVVKQRNEAVDRVKDLYRGDDGQAWKEVRKFLEEIGETEFLASTETEKGVVG
jgi:hypothetical protein